MPEDTIHGDLLDLEETIVPSNFPTSLTEMFMAGANRSSSDYVARGIDASKNGVIV